ncbi:MAG: hypothetical protein AAF736_04930 [Pseudomonadota bacterium]
MADRRYTRMLTAKRTTALLAALWIATNGLAQETSPGADIPFVNWENHPVHPMDSSPDGTLLAVAHTADNRLQLFDVSEGLPVAAGHVVVGVDPVSVRFRSNNEAWVVNHISDTVSVVDLAGRQVTATLQTDDEPFDIVFAGDPLRAFVSCSQANTILVYNVQDLSQPPERINLSAEDPRSLAVSPDGSKVYAAIFESGNGSTVLGGGAESLGTISFPPNVTRQTNTPSGGESPAPNAGTGFSPALNPLLPPPPQVGTIVKKNGDGVWLDDIGGDWTRFVSGFQANQSGRIDGWDLPDRDVAVIDAGSLEVSYVTALMNINMALAVNPASGEITVVGTDATNEVRFEPLLNGRFLRVNLARIRETDNAVLSVSDLNPHLTYASSTTTADNRLRSLGDPRSIVWNAAGTRGFVTGMGSSNLIVINADGGRVGDPIDTGEGPVGAVLNEEAGLLYVWNHFEASISVIELATSRRVSTVALFNPLPRAMRDGRRFLYDTRQKSGLGHVSCGSCHVDGRTDRLAWDLGDPSGDMKAFNQNCVTEVQGNSCPDFHPMKGPMMTQTLQDIIGHEPFHWRGDRDGLEEFNGAFTGLLGADAELSEAGMQAFEDHLATITFPPNPFRNLDNTLPRNLPLPGHVTTGKFGPANQPLPNGNAQRGLLLYTTGGLDEPFQCSDCHTLPTGMSRNGPLRLLGGAVEAGGEQMADGPHGEDHLGIVSVDGNTNIAMKTAQLRNLYDKVGMDAQSAESLSGFGFLHDGSVDTLARFVALEAFELDSDQDVADLVALMLAFSGSDFGPDPSPGSVTAPQSQDTHAAVGRQVTSTGGSPTSELNTLSVLAAAGAIDLVAHGSGNSWVQQGLEFSPAQGDSIGLRDLSASASAAAPITFTAVSSGLGERLGLDRDHDGLTDAEELRLGSNPADAASRTLTPVQGLWFNPARSGHGFDLQRLGNFLFITWYTYNDDGTPTWYQAAGEFDGESWSADLSRFTRGATGDPTGQPVGQASLAFVDARRAEFSWTLDGRSGSEPFQLLAASNDRTLRNYTGTWYDPDDSGWGVTFYSQGDVRVSVLYFYDAERQPRWVLGQSDNHREGNTAMLSFSGFCPDCERVEPQSTSAGDLTLSFDSVRSGTFSSSARYPGLANSDWNRSNVAIIPLSDPWQDPALH